MLTLRPYQCDGAIWLAESRRALLGDDPGVGKTPQTITAAKIVKPSLIVVICPAVAVENWRAEFRLWWPEHAKLIVLSYEKATMHSATRRVLANLPEGYLLIVDEAHYLKSQDSKRTKFILKPLHNRKSLSGRAGWVWELSGTFAPNHVGEYWPHLRSLFPELIPGLNGKPMSYMEFIQRFTNWAPGVHGGVKVYDVKPECRAALEHILSIAGLRRTKEEVLPELPPLTWSTVVVPAEHGATELQHLESTPEVEALREHLAEHEDFLPDSAVLSTLRRLTGIVKAPAVAKLIAEELTNNHYQKIVVFAWHTEVINTVAHWLTHFGLVAITGKTPQKQRAAAVTKFQTDKDVRVFLGQLEAAGTAITLTAADQVLFVEPSWVPAHMLQGAGRCQRFGQTNPVTARIASLAGSLDTVITAVIRKKLQNKVEIGEHNVPDFI